ncbi:MAG: serpin family protein [Rhodospirillaceae bacterium]|nr:serpin family protein [Rhodospirillaceae bacterium]
MKNRGKRTASALDVTEPAPIAHLTAPTASAADVARLADGHRTFAVDLYQFPRSTTGNLFFSPYSLSLSLGMLAAGAREETAGQIAETVHFSLPPGVLHPAVNALDLAVRLGAGNSAPDGGPTGRAYHLAIANALWHQPGSPMLPAYRDVLSRYYGAELPALDFRGDPDGARRRVNDWVREQTDGHVPELLVASAVHGDTRLVLTNTVAFEGRWRTSFDEGETTNRSFHLHDGAQVETPTMRGDVDIGYARRGGYLVIDLPYEGGAATMTALRLEAGRFDQFERRLDAGLLGQALASLEDMTVELYMSLVEFEATVDLIEMLAEMGMPDTSDPARANLSGINAIACPARACLYIDVATQKVFVSVDDDGTNAVAATGIGTTLVSGRPVLPTVRIDRPVVFIMRDVPTGTIFLGRVVHPR